MQHRENPKYRNAIVRLLLELGFRYYDDIRYVRNELCIYVDSRLTCVKIYKSGDTSYMMPIEGYNYNSRDYDAVKEKIVELVNISNKMTTINEN